MKKLRLTALAGLFIFNSSLADTIPVQNTALNVTFDKRGLPESLYIWDSVSGGESPDNPELLGRNSLVCLSASDTTNGACSTAPIWWQQSDDPYNSSIIPLRFCNDKGVCKNIEITGYHTENTGRKVKTYTPITNGGFNKGNPFSYIIPQSSISTLPAGTWKATLKQNLMQWDPEKILRTWTADITLTVTDTASQTVYFPDFESGNPSVDLQLQGTPSGSSGGSNHLDMCLYDGGIAANNIAITFRDEGKSAPGRSAGAFSVYREGGAPAKAEDRIDYNLQVQNPVNLYTEKVSNGVQINWVGAAASSFRRQQVMLPGGRDMVWCVPAPLTLVTPSFPTAGKKGGHYTGRLTVIYAPTTSG